MLGALYHAYEARRLTTQPLYLMAALTTKSLQQLPAPLAASPLARYGIALTETVSSLRLTHERPAFGIDSVLIEDRPVPVAEEVVTSTPFGSLVRFTAQLDADRPRVLIVPGLAGHFATLVRGTVRTLLTHHDVYVADWHNARDVPWEAGPFGLDEYIEHLMLFLEAIGPGGHLVAVCQPCAAAIAAAAIMGEDDHPCQPSSLVLMAGPVDARVNPGRVNQFAARQSLALLERTVIMTVPRPYEGAGRRVYPGFLQVMGFMGMGPRRHVDAISGLFNDVAQRAYEDARRTQDFYREFFAVLDVAAEFYLDTARVVFKDHDLALGRMKWRGRRVDPAAITGALLTIEGANDELCPPGQTAAAHDLCVGLPPERKVHHVAPGVGHYGVFSGSRFEREIYPKMRAFIAANQGATSVTRH
jgi:poly(3-hydroxybutyrate) depolymerase